MILRLLLIFILLRIRNCQISYTNASSCTFPVSQFNALQSFYDSTGGPTWCVNDHEKVWNFSSSTNTNAPCADPWVGIYCECVESQYHMIYLSLPHLCLNGSIPSSISEFNDLQLIGLSFNRHLGSIPPSIGSLVNLRYFYIDYANLTGSIPSSVGLLSNMIGFSLDESGLHGSIPSSISNLNKLTVLSLQNNFLTGTIPDGITKCANLTQISLFYNYLTGSIPTNIGNLNQLIGLSIDVNLLEGPIPNSLGEATGLLELYIDTNYLTSTIPASFGNLSHLFYLFISANHLTGTIPLSSNRFRNLQAISIYTNHLSGTLPSNIINIDRLTQILANGNMLSGNPFLSMASPDLDPNATFSFQVISFTNNLFTGTVPPLFLEKSANLENFLCGYNCFQGTIADSICNLQDNLVELDFSSMGGNTLCPTNRDFNLHRPSYVNGIFSSFGLSGTIPSCLFEFHNLTKLHLFGNNLSGNLPAIPLSKSLTHLSVSYNSLTGSIPPHIQSHDFAVLELSNNRLDGTLIDMFAISSFQTTLSLAVNRLSGKLPTTIANLLTTSSSNDSDSMTMTLSSPSTTLTTLNVLANNIFSCNNEDLPSLDQYSHSYSCGSYELNVASYLWLVVAGMIAIVICIVFLLFRVSLSDIISKSSSYRILRALITLSHNIMRNMKRWWTSADSVFDTHHHGLNALSHLKSDHISTRNELRGFLTIIRVLKFLAGIFGLMIIFVVIPAFIIMHQHSSIVSYDYGFIMSMAFLHGATPVIFLSIVIMIVLSFCLFVLIVLLSILKPWFVDARGRILIPGKRNPSNGITFIAHFATKSQDQSTFRNISYYVKKYSFVIISHIINLTITTTVNSIYVNTILNPGLTRFELLVIQACIAMFKFMWSATYIPLCTNIIEAYLSHARNMQSRIVMLLANFILAPCIATLVINQSCFYYVFYPSPSVSSYTVVSECGQFVPCDEGICCLSLFNVTFETISRPSFHYSYACGTALLVAYAPVLLYSYVFYSLIVPVIRFIMIYNITSLSSFIHMISNVTMVHRVRGRDIIVRLMLNMTVLLTFGIAIPILGITIVVGIINDCFLSKLMTGRIIDKNQRSMSNRTVMSSSLDISTSSDMASINPMYRSTRESKGYEMQSRHAPANIPANRMTEFMSQDHASLDTSQYHGLDVYDSWYGLYVCFPYLALVTSTFWALIYFDMIADIASRGIEMGMLTTLTFGIIVPFIILGSYYMVFPRSGHREPSNASTPAGSGHQAHHIPTSSTAGHDWSHPPRNTEILVTRLFRLDSMVHDNKKPLSTVHSIDSSSRSTRSRMDHDSINSSISTHNDSVMNQSFE